jgi:apolipoprotein N-acyltransferase
MIITKTWHRLVAVLLSVVLLSLGWFGLSGLSLLVALVPLLIISEGYSDSRRDWWRMCGWAALTFLLWNFATIWWVWNAAPIGVFTASIVGSFYNLCGVMVYHYTSKRASRALAYVLLVSVWIATEWAYNSAQVMTFPWLLLGHGFSTDIWAVQWYEYTGVFGGALWVLCSNVAIFEALRTRLRNRILYAGAIVIMPVIISLSIYWGYEPSSRSVQMSVVQPNIPCYDEERLEAGMMNPSKQVLGLMASVPEDTQYVLMPESMLAYLPYIGTIEESETEYYAPMFKQLHGGENRDMKLVVGASTMRNYGDVAATDTARESDYGYYYDLFNSALLINAEGDVEQIYHKQKLVIGVEAIPFRNFLKNFEVDLGGVSGQLGWGEHHVVFDEGGAKVGPAICYEGLYGNHFAGFAREGAEVMAVLSNDGWWGDTPGHRCLFDFCRLRAIESRRAIARSANTGISGFISPRGEIIGERLEWNERGVLTETVELRNDITFYMMYGDVIARVATFVAFLAFMYFMAYRIKRRNYLVE